MKIYIPPVIHEKDLQFPLEVFAAISYMTSIDYFNQIVENNGIWNDGIFSRLLLNFPCHEFTDLESCDIIVLPFKFEKNDNRINTICDNSKGKRVIAFYCDDSSEKFNIPKNLIIFRTSLFKTKKGSQERSMPAIVADHMPCNMVLSDKVENKTISYCGHLLHNRDLQLSHLSSIYDKVNIKTREGFWAPGVNKIQARREYYNNLLSGGFAFCSRGAGNFSYRFYEALSFGRIPILIDTDCELPFERDNNIQWDNHIIRIPENEFFNLNKMDFISLIDSKLDKLSPSMNRRLWQNYFSPEGYFENFYLDI